MSDTVDLCGVKAARDRLEQARAEIMSVIWSEGAALEHSGTNIVLREAGLKTSEAIIKLLELQISVEGARLKKATASVGENNDNQG